MQLTINLNDLTTKTRLELFALLDLITPVHPNQGTLPLTDVAVKEEPVKKRATKPKEVPTSEEKVEEVTEPTPEVETSGVTLAELKELAQRRVASSDRESVKGVISKYADKLSEVKESDYLDLYDDLNNLKGA